MKFLKKLQNLPLRTRKMILWLTTGILGIIFFGIWIYSLQQHIERFQQNYQNKPIIAPFPKIEIPEIRVPTFSEEEIKEMEKEFQKKAKELELPTSTTQTLKNQ